MIKALAALLGSASTVAACYAAGCLLIGRLHLKLSPIELLPQAFLLGAACLHLAVFALLALHIAYWPVLVALLAAVIAAGIWRGCFARDAAAPGPQIVFTRNQKQLLVVLFGAFTLLYFFHALAPEESPDGSGYHLGLVARDLRTHAFETTPVDMYADLGAGVEMLFLPAFAIGRHSAAALVHFAFTLALALLMFAYGCRVGKPWAGVVGAFLTFASPITGIDGSSAYVDVAVAAIVFSVFYWLQVWDEHRALAALIPVGVLAGYAYDAKYTAFTILPFALGFILWRARAFRPAAITACLSLGMIAPWVLKNWVTVQNPVAPFGNRYFRNANFHISWEQEYAAYYRRLDLPSLSALPLEVTLRGGATQGVAGLVFLAAPIALLALRESAGRRLLAAAAFAFAPYFLNIGTRFLIPALPFLSLAMALALASFPVALAALMVLHAATSWPAGLRMYADSSAWSLRSMPVEAALRIVPQDGYLRETAPAYGVARMIEDHVRPRERVLALDNVWTAYTSRDVLVSYESAFGDTLADMLSVGFLAARQPRILETFQFPVKTVRRVRLISTGAPNPPQQWSIHELRFYAGGVEIPRQNDWRLRASPDPWEVQLAFDNSEATRWRSWESAGPGMYLDVDFGKPTALDQVRVETSDDSSRVPLALETLDGAGRWVSIAANPAVTPIAPRGNLRIAASSELKSRGIDYLLVESTYAGAADILNDPGGWGLQPVAKGYGARLYRIIP